MRRCLRLRLISALARRGPLALWRRLRHEVWVATGGARRALADPLPPSGPFLGAAAAPIGLERTTLARLLTEADRTAPPPSLAPRADASAPWYAIDPYANGDLRLAWEAGRWSALPRLALATRSGGGERFRDAVEAQISSFLAAAPPYRGPMWASAQEAAIRLIHVVAAARLLGSAPTEPARALVRILVDRISATLTYERSQLNNHGIVCAAALAGAGAWIGDEALRRRGLSVLSADLAWSTTAGGGFAQVSTRYHRMVLDALSFAALLAGPLPGPVMERARAMTVWLARVTDAATGRTPRLGHDDGSVLLEALGADPDDARPSLARAAAAFGTAPIDPVAALAGLGPVPIPKEDLCWIDREGGTAGLRQDGAIGLMRLPCGRFPPGQADLFHLSLLYRGEELLRDAGTWLYNPPPGETDLAGTAHHNTAQWGEADRPARLGRFLFAPTPRRARAEAEPGRLHAEDREQVRTVEAAAGSWTITDRLARPGAILRWRLAASTWVRRPDGVEGDSARLCVVADGPLSLRLAQGWDSPRYGQRARCPVLVVHPQSSVRVIVTTLSLR